MELDDMVIEKRKLSELHPAEYNPRVALQPGDPEYEKLARSIEVFGYVDPIIINRDGTVIGGHQRLRVMQDAGINEVKCVVVDVDKDKEKSLNVALNNIEGKWDNEKLKDLLVELDGSDIGIDLTGFDRDELEALIVEIDGIPETAEDDFDMDSVPEDEIIAKEGQIWQLGKHRLICGDSTNPNVYEALMKGDKANLVVTDPPYNVNYQGTAGKIKNDNMGNDDFYMFLFDAFTCMKKVMSDDSSIYVFHSDTEGLNFRKAFQDAGFYLSGCCIWAKQSLVLGRSPYQWQHEPVLFGWKKDGKHQWYSDRKQTTIWKFDKPQKNGDHPTMKPIPLIAYPITNSSMSNCIVLDPFGGSGSTLIACEQTNRICYTIELDPHYCDVIIARWEEFTGEKAVLIDG